MNLKMGSYQKNMADAGIDRARFNAVDLRKGQITKIGQLFLR